MVAQNMFCFSCDTCGRKLETSFVMKGEDGELLSFICPKCCNDIPVELNDILGSLEETPVDDYAGA